MALFVAPFLGAMHRHPSDHDGAVEHIEARHGSHASAAVETDAFLTSAGPKCPLIALLPSLPDLAVVPTISNSSEVHEPSARPARAPPSSTRSRAPPVLS